MKQWAMRAAAMAAMAAGLVTSGWARADDKPKLIDGDRVAILGDSITEQKNYSVLIEDYLLACQPAMKLQAAQFGWGGETTWGCAPRMAQDILWFKPTAATIAYGMNDGGYSDVKQQRLDDYKKNMTDIVQQLKSSGTRLIVVGGPGVVDRDAFDRDGKPQGAHAKLYNATLATFNDAAREVAAAQGVAFADLNTVMAKAMEKFKQQHPDKSFVGGDGVHPDNVGHAVMAYAFLKALGCDGDIGTIKVDLSAHRAEVTAGHKVISMDGDTLTLESTRYPFQAKKSDDPMSVYSAMSVVPFQEDLNRFKLTVSGIAAGKKVKVTWTEIPAGTMPATDHNKPIEVSKTFDAEQLQAGINLSSAFDTTPFEHAFAQLDAAVHSQQDFETPLNKNWLHREKDLAAQFPTAAANASAVAEKGKAMDDELRGLSGAMVVPVRHMLRFEVQ